MSTKFSEKRFIDIMKLSKALGWENIRLHGHLYENEIIVHFYDGDMDGLFFQANILPTVQCAVYDIPHKIYTGWHEANSRKLAADMDSEIVRLEPILSIENYKTAKKRKLLLKEHPEFYGFSWAKGGGLMHENRGRIY